jgi:stearoyl-CoA desaturase (delta-9 desaturase)
MLVLDQAPPPAPSRRPPPDGVPTSFRWQQAVTGLIVLAPLAGLIWAVANVRAHPPSALDLALAVAMYLVTGHGVTVGFHRLFTHRSYRARRPLKLALAVAGSMAFQGPLLGWVADHRRHHVFTDVAGDPHSPHLQRPGLAGVVRGALHAHTGWLFEHDPTDPERYARDIARDPDLRRVTALFPLWCVVSLGLPFALGWVIGGSLGTASSALLWAGLVRVAVLHEVTWSINSICHLVGRRPHDTPDRSTNVALLSVVSMGESFHNTHHAFPRSARHGLDRGQLDSSAALIGLFRRLGWADEVRLPAATPVR